MSPTSAAHGRQSSHAAISRRVRSPISSRIARVWVIGNSLRSPSTTSRSTGSNARRSRSATFVISELLSTCLPRKAVARPDDRSVECGGFLRPFRCHSHHAFGPAAALRRGVAHPCLDEALVLDPIQGCVQRADRTVVSGMPFDFLPNRRPVRIVAESGRGRQQEIFELTQHDYFYIVILIRGERQGATA